MNRITIENYFESTRIAFEAVNPLQVIELLGGYKKWRKQRNKGPINTSFGTFIVDFESERKNSYFCSRSLSYYFVNVETDELIRVSDHWSESNSVNRLSKKLNCGHIATCFWSNLDAERVSYKMSGERYYSVFLGGKIKLSEKTDDSIQEIISEVKFN